MSARRPPQILVEGLVRRFGETRALDGLNLRVEAGSIAALLGPNGAGKTTTVQILATLLEPHDGIAVVGGYDVVKHPDAVRRIIAHIGQFATVDEQLTGRENLELFGRLHHLGAARARARAREMLMQFALEDVADRMAKTYSGGMRRRLDLAVALVSDPSVLFLDEPTTGLDPRSRRGVWQLIRDLRDSGTAVLLTTQYLEEADALADRIVVIDNGRVIVEGTGEELKRQVGGERLEVTLTGGEELRCACALLTEAGHTELQVDEQALRVSTPIDAGSRQIGELVARLNAAGLEIEDLHIRPPTLDDVFFTFTAESPDAINSDSTAAETASVSR